MLGRLILLIVFVIAVVTILRLIRKTPKSQSKSMYWKIGLSGLAIVLVLLAATGRIHWIGAMIGALIPLVRRLLPFLIRYFPMITQYINNNNLRGNPSSNNCSQVQTTFLNMTLNHDNNQLSGEVISGPFAGNNLDQLELDQLKLLLADCQQDKDSVKLLLTYLNHRFGNDWQQHSEPSRSENLTEQSALSILGLNPGASKQEVIQAHRRIMQKVHPDRGGSDYLAAQANAAKDLLMSKLT